ncbi:MAG TPA: hybrid sensor histidine kinase/response regulator [Usitatibacter sp.]
MSATAAKSRYVQYEVLAIGYRAYPRALLNGCVFACITVALEWPALPQAFLVGWLVAFIAIAAARLALARAFLRSAQAADELASWTRYAALGYAGAGLAWGALGAAAIHFTQGMSPLYPMWIVFLITIFAALQTQTTGAHRVVFMSFLIGAMGPIIAISAIEPSPNYALRLAAELVLFAIAAFAGRAGNRYVVESIAMRHENLELLQDITRQKEELDKANAAKTHFLAAASHDLRQPMQAVVLLVESLQERVTEPDTRRIVKSIRSSVTSMAALLNAILDVSRFEAGTVRPERSDFRVVNVLERLRSTYAQQAVDKGLDLRVVRSAAVVETDPILLFRILANITNNALRYTDRGKVLIGCRRRGAAIAIEVWDTGPGIPEDQLKDIFREFYQLENPHRDRELGIGLGLAIVERTARLLEHPIAVRSRVGRGSMFSILVRRGDPSRIDTADKSRRPDWAALHGCTVLVVEDDKEVRAAMGILLESWGCTVMSAASAAEILPLLRANAAVPDVVLADYRLPGEDNGIDVIRTVQALHSRADGILISGDIAPEVLRKAEDAGLKLLHKPLRPARLRALLGNVWRERSAANAEATAPEPVEAS